MKNVAIALPLQLMLVIILYLPCMPVYSQSLKNVKIGQKYSGLKSVETTIEGYSGILTIGSLNDGTVCSFHFVSRNQVNGRTEMPVIIADADNFLIYVNRNFDISLDCKYWKHKELSAGSWNDVATCSKDSIAYLLSFSANLGENLSYLLLTVTHEGLSNKGANEHLIK